MSGLWKRTKMAKIDEQGNYVPYYGYTVLSMLNERPSSIEEFIKETEYLSQHVAPVPASSYHVTLFNIFTHQKVPKKYKPKSGGIPKDAWIGSKQLHLDLTFAQKKCLHVKENIFLTKKSLGMGTYPGEPLWFTVSLSSEAEVADLRKTCSQIFGKEDPLVFHVTLGYIFRAIGQDVAQDIDRELEGLWEIIQDSYSLQQPDVYLFSSMEHYIPFGQAEEAILYAGNEGNESSLCCCSHSGNTDKRERRLNDERERSGCMDFCCRCLSFLGVCCACLEIFHACCGD